MKVISEYIAELTALQDVHGDLPLVIESVISGELIPPIFVREDFILVHPSPDAYEEPEQMPGPMLVWPEGEGESDTEGIVVFSEA